MKDTARIAVIGAGWAGCAAAVELVSQHSQVTLFESARTAGGRARRVEVDGRLLDNGQHILLGAYTESLRLMRHVGLSPEASLLRLPLQMRYPAGDGMDFMAPRLPAPWHVLVALLRARGLDREDKLALARFSTTARWMGWMLHQDCSVTELLERYDQTDRLIRLMWRPLCVAALNTPPEEASAQIFLNVLRDSLGARRAASDMLIPRVDLSALLPQAAVRHVEEHGGKLITGQAVTRITRQNDGWQLDSRKDRYDGVVVATSPWQAIRLLAPHMDTSLIEALRYVPITTCYLQYAPHITLPLPMQALIDDPEQGDWGQFVFDRGALDAHFAGMLAVVVSASGNAIGQDHDLLAAGIARQLARVFNRPELATPRWSKLISEKRATFACTPGLKRPDNETGVAGLVIAGDYTAGEYPATLESAVRSGVQAAHCLLDHS